ncbi:FAD binding domain-containing protein [Sphaerimonospora mesophila]|uniref:FAD binding domain-containing protein n=1 Tax=Sphaerimonospora mesophila TaxID=37483 RepID=UPI0006E2C4EB
MKPAPFTYHDPPTVSEVLGLLSEHGGEAAVLAGGQSLIPLMNLRLARPGVVVDVNRVAGLDHVEIGRHVVRIGATARLADLERHEGLAEVLPVLPAAIRHVAHPQIRNRTTLGGSISHADPSAELPAVLLATGGRVRLESVRGSRRVPADDFFLSPFRTSRRPDELLTSVEFPIGGGLRFLMDEVARREGGLPVVSVVLGVRTGAGGPVAEARAAASGVADRPVRLRRLERHLTGADLGDPVVRRAAADMAGHGLEPPDDLRGGGAYRMSLLRALVERLLEGAAA